MTADDNDIVAAVVEALKAHRMSSNGANTTKKYPFKLIPFADLKPGTKSAYLVDEVIPSAGLVVVWGPPKCGKSFWVFDITMRIALNWSYRGRRVHGGPVVYIAFEGAAGFGDRKEAFKLTHLDKQFDIGEMVNVEVAGSFIFPNPVKITKIFESNGSAWACVEGSNSAVQIENLRRVQARRDIPFFLVAGSAKLVRSQQALIESIDGQVGDLPPVCVVIDTLNRSIDGSESKDEDMGAYITAAEAIVEEFDCAVIIVHHCGIDGTRPRGHTSLTCAVAAQIAVKRDAAGHTVTTVEYMKDGPEGASFTSALKLLQVSTNDEGKPMMSCAVLPVTQDTADTGKTRRKTTDRQALALRALAEVVRAEGRDPPKEFELPGGVKVVAADAWKTELLRKNVLDAEAKNLRARFAELRNSLAARCLIGSRDEWVWLAERLVVTTGNTPVAMVGAGGAADAGSGSSF